MVRPMAAKPFMSSYTRSAIVESSPLVACTTTRRTTMTIVIARPLKRFEHFALCMQRVQAVVLLILLLVLFVLILLLGLLFTKVAYLVQEKHRGADH